MDNDQKNVKDKNKIAPNFNNDQTGENASMEFAEMYDNKSNDSPNKSRDKK